MLARFNPALIGPRRAAVLTALSLALTAPNAAAIDLTSNLENSTFSTETATTARWLAASFGTGASARTLNSVTLTMANTVAGAAELRIYRDGGLEPGALVATLTSPATYPTTLANTTFSSHGGVALLANTTYWAVLRPISGQFNWAWTDNNTGSGVGFQGTWGASDTDATLWWTQDIYPLQLSATADLPICPVDYNADGAVNVQDFLAFLTGYAAAAPAADFNADGQINVQDFLSFLAAYAVGC